MPGKCVVCGKEKGRNKLYCSVKCRAEAQRNMRKCVICGKEFYSAPSGTERTCSRECSAKLRHFYGMSEQNKEVLKKHMPDMKNRRTQAEKTQMQMRKAG